MPNSLLMRNYWSPKQITDGVLDLVRTGAEQADLVLEQFGGSYQS